MAISVGINGVGDLEQCGIFGEFCAINAKQVEIKFSQPVLESTVVTTPGSQSVLKNITFAGVGVAGTDHIALTSASIEAELSEDGKTLTVTADPNTAGEIFKGKYTVTVPLAVTDVDGNAIEFYNKELVASDTVRPTVKGVTYGYAAGNQIATLEFSEPVDITNATFSFARVDGVALGGGTPANTKFDNTPIAAVTGSNDTKFVIVFDVVDAADENKDIKVTVTGLKDYAGNLATPNPLTTIIKMDTTDTVAAKYVSSTVKNNRTLRVVFDKALSATPGAGNFNLGGATSNAVTPVAGTNSTTYDVGFAADMPTGLQTLTLPVVVDTMGNSSAAGITKLITITLDKVAPALQSAVVEKIANVDYLVLTYDKNVTPQTGKTVNLTYLENYVTTPATIASAVNLTAHNVVGGVSKSVKLDLSSLTVPAEYTAELPLGLVKDVNLNDSAVKTGVKFTKTVVNKPAITTAIVQNSADNNIVDITFNKKVDPLTALNKANYSIEGAIVEDVTLTSNAATATVELKLAQDSSTFTGARTVVVSGVKSESGDVMDTHTEVVTLKENIAPTFTGTLIGTDVIKVVFSEPIAHSTLATELTGTNFVVKVDGVANTVKAVWAATTGTSGADDTGGNVGIKTVYLELTNAVTDLTKPITLSATDIQDVSKVGATPTVIGNKVVTTVVNVTN